MKNSTVSHINSMNCPVIICVSYPRFYVIMPRNKQSVRIEVIFTDKMSVLCSLGEIYVIMSHEKEGHVAINYPPGWGGIKKGTWIPMHLS